MMVMIVRAGATEAPHHPLMVRLVEVLAVNQGLIDGLSWRVYDHLVMRMVVLLVPTDMLMVAAALRVVRVGRPSSIDHMHGLGGVLMLMVTTVDLSLIHI